MINSFFKNNIDDTLIKIQICLLFLIPVSLITGPFLSDLFLVIIAILYLILCIKNNNWEDFKNYLPLFFFMWCGYLLIRSLFSNNILLSLESSLFFFRFGIFALAVSNILKKDINKKISKYFLYFLIATFSIVVIDALFQYIFGYNFLFYEYKIKRFARLTGLFQDESILGSYLIRLLPILVALILYQYSVSKKVLFYSGLLLIFTNVVIFLSGERAAFGLLLLFIISSLFLLSRFRIFRLILIFFSFLMMILISLTNNQIKSRMIDYTLEQNRNSIIYSPEHDLLFMHAYDIFLQNKIFGIGTKMFRQDCKLDKYNSFNQKDKIGINKDICSTHPHNYFLQLLAETGLVGTIPFLFLFLFVSYKFLKQFYFKYFKNKIFLDDASFCCLCGIMICIWPIFPTGNFFNNWLNIFLFLNIGVYLGIRKE